MAETPEMRLRVLVVDDEPTAREVLRLGVARQGCETVVAEDAASAIALLSRERFHAVITDKNMPGTDHPTEGGLDVIPFAKKVNPGCAVLMVTGYASVESAIEAMQLGAFDYVTKPIQADELKAKLDRVLQYQQTIDPAGTLSAYSGFRDEFVALLDREAAGQHLDEEAKAHLLAIVQRQLDLLFRERREWEQLIFEQREALTRIAAWAEELKEVIVADGRAAELLARISSEVNHRV
jgi:DNA-binding NtrC family response regulator